MSNPHEGGRYFRDENDKLVRADHDGKMPKAPEPAQKPAQPTAPKMKDK